MDYINSLRNSYFYKLKEALEPAFQGKVEIIESDDPKYIAKLEHSFGKIGVKLQGTSKITFEKYGSFESWDEGRILAGNILKRLDAMTLMSIKNIKVLEDKLQTFHSKLAAIWEAKPGEGLQYSTHDDSYGGPQNKTTVFNCSHAGGSELNIISKVVKNSALMTVDFIIRAKAAEASHEEEVVFRGKSTTSHTHRLDGALKFLDLAGSPTAYNDFRLKLNFNVTSNLVLTAYTLGIGKIDPGTIRASLASRPRIQSRHGHGHRVLRELDPNNTQKINTDYGIAGYAVKGNTLIVQLFDLPIKFETEIPAGDLSATDNSQLLKDVNASFEEQFLKFRSRDSWNVNPEKGKFESLDKQLDKAFFISESIEADAFNHVKSVLNKIISSQKLEGITIEPGKKVKNRHIIAKLKKPGSSFWIILDRWQTTVKPGGFAGQSIYISSDQELVKEITKWYHTPVIKKRVSKVSPPPRGVVRAMPTRTHERFPGQEKYKDIEKSKYFPRAVYHREGSVPGTYANSGVAGSTDFMLSIHAADSLIDFQGTGEKGKLPAGLFTGLDLHAVSTSGNRPGHVGWIGGYHNEDTLYIIEAQSDLMQRTWDLIDKSKRDEDTSVGSGKKRQIVRSQKHKIRELASQLKQARVEFANMQQQEYGSISEKYKLLERIQDLNAQVNSAKNRYKKFTRLPMYSQYKSQLENLFKDWIKALYTDAFNFARDKEISEIKIISTAGVQNMHRNVNIKDKESSIYHRLYDKIAIELGAELDGKWWTIQLNSIPKTESFTDKIGRLLNEAVYGNKATVFHKTGSPDKVLSIAKWGFFPSLGGMHGQGLYAVFDPDKSKNAWLNASSYGNLVIKMAVNLSNKILILDYDTAKKFYGSNYKVSDQLDQMGVNWRRQDMSEFDPHELQKSVDYSDIEEIVHKLDTDLEHNAKHVNVRDVSYSSLRFDINGVFFIGGHGHELVGFDTAIFKPMAFAKISGRENSINDLEWHKFDREGIDFIYREVDHNLPPKEHWLRQL